MLGRDLIDEKLIVRGKKEEALTLRMLISFPRRFCDLARLFFVMLLMATTKVDF